MDEAGTSRLHFRAIGGHGGAGVALGSKALSGGHGAPAVAAAARAVSTRTGKVGCPCGGEPELGPGE